MLRVVLLAWDFLGLPFCVELCDCGFCMVSVTGVVFVVGLLLLLFTHLSWFPGEVTGQSWMVGCFEFG